MRTVRNINKNWYFSKNASSVPVTAPDGWQRLDLPYTWNGEDGQDGGNDYYRGKGYFARSLSKAELTENDVTYFQFDGVNSSAAVYLNGKELCTHDGGYSAFRAAVDRSALKDENLLVVVADNSPNDRVYPQTADFTFYGGIYRDVSIISVNACHFCLDAGGSPGIRVTPEVKGTDAVVSVESRVTSEKDGFTVVYEILADGKTVAKINADENNRAVVELENVHLWDGTRDPFLYELKASLFIDSGQVDEISTRFGCRTVKIDPQNGFFLNGRSYPLRGVSRHQDRPGVGNALTPEMHREDIGLILEVGANSVRLAHYQHSQVFYDLCDEKGLIVWAEIPYISRHMPNGVENTKTQLTELICQNYNHPSIAVWGISNEITMNGDADPSMLENHRILNELAHSLDPTRPTTVAVLSTCPADSEYVKISDVLAYNHYFGWYGGKADMYGAWYDGFHAKNPNRAVGLSEYGAEALNWHTSSPEQGDYTEEYQALYHEEVIAQLAARPWIWSTYVWNMFDFAADARSEGGENGMNHKGLVTFDRQYKKDAFYAYKAWLSDEPFVHICGKRYVNRAENETAVTVYTNLPEVELFANGKSVGVMKRDGLPFYHFRVTLDETTELLARAGELTDFAVIKRVEKPDESYIMKDANAVINWFEITTPPGKMSVNDSIGEIMSSVRGKLLLVKTALAVVRKMKKGGGSTGGMGDMAKGMKINRSLIEMGKSFTVKRVCMMAGGLFTKEQILELNRSLNKISKKKK